MKFISACSSHKSTGPSIFFSITNPLFLASNGDKINTIATVRQLSLPFLHLSNVTVTCQLPSVATMSNYLEIAVSGSRPQKWPVGTASLLGKATKVARGSPRVNEGHIAGTLDRKEANSNNSFP